MLSKMLLGLSVALAGCGVVDGGPIMASIPATPDYFPLDPGSRWVYAVDDEAMGWRYEMRVAVVSEGDIPALGRRGTIVRETYRSDDAAFFRAAVEPMAYFWEAGFLQRVFLTERDEGLVPVDGMAELRVLPRKIVPGETWSGDGVSFQVGAGGFAVRHRHRVVLEREPIDVRGRRFAHCIRVDTVSRHVSSAGKRDGRLVFYYSDWYAPGIGLVRTELWDDADHVRRRLKADLIGWSVGGTSERGITIPDPGPAGRVRI